MPWADKLLLPNKIVTAGWVMIAALTFCIGLQYYFDIQTIKLVKTVFFYLVLDYIWATVKREFFPDLS